MLYKFFNKNSIDQKVLDKYNFTIVKMWDLKREMEGDANNANLRKLYDKLKVQQSNLAKKLKIEKIDQLAFTENDIPASYKQKI